VDSLLLELLAPKRLGVSCESPNIVEDHKKVCVWGLHLPKVLKNTTNMFFKYNTFTGTFGLGIKLYTI
jgi:hypothetical protein